MEEPTSPSIETLLPDLPARIARMVRGKDFHTDDVGKEEGSRVFLFDDMVLKVERLDGIEAVNDRIERTVGMMRWLADKLPVPEVLHAESDGSLHYLLMSRIEGRMACHGFWLERPEELIELLAQALRMVWNVEISDCPRTITLDEDLAIAQKRVELGLVDGADTEPGTFGPGGFDNPQALLEWLIANKPPLDPVLSHGDFCLPNIFLRSNEEDDRHGSGISGFIDFGSTGIADRWKDIALLTRSLEHNFDGSYGGIPYPGYDPYSLFDALGIEPDWEKIRYYRLLDELF